MTERETTRLIAWSTEIRRVHARLREALTVARDAVARGEPGERAGRDLLIYCRGFCVALDGHHRGEDRALFPAVEAAYPHLGPVLRALERDHSMIAHLLGGLTDAVDEAATPADLELHLDGIGAIMESHFRYEERQLLVVLDELALDGPIEGVLGPL